MFFSNSFNKLIMCFCVPRVMWVSPGLNNDIGKGILCFVLFCFLASLCRIREIKIGNFKEMYELGYDSLEMIE